VDIYDIEEKTAALEAIQALRAARSQGNRRVGTALTAEHTPISTYNAEPLIFHDTSLTDLAAVDVVEAFTRPVAAGSPRNLVSPVRATQPGAVFFSDATTPPSRQVSGLSQGGDLNALIQHAVDAAVLDKLQNDSEVQKVSARGSVCSVFVHAQSVQATDLANRLSHVSCVRLRTPAFVCALHALAYLFFFSARTCVLVSDN
jgi:hypothetical protein